MRHDIVISSPIQTVCRLRNCNESAFGSRAFTAGRDCSRFRRNLSIQFFLLSFVKSVSFPFCFVKISKWFFQTFPSVPQDWFYHHHTACLFCRNPHYFTSYLGKVPSSHLFVRILPNITAHTNGRKLFLVAPSLHPSSFSVLPLQIRLACFSTRIIHSHPSCLRLLFLLHYFCPSVIGAPHTPQNLPIG